MNYITVLQYKKDSVKIQFKSSVKGINEKIYHSLSLAVHSKTIGINLD